MLTRQGHESDEHQRGIVIHDRSATERRVQNWADRWRLIESRIGVSGFIFVDVPFFADSQASRLLQAANFVRLVVVASTAWRLPMSVGSNPCGHTSTKPTARCTAWSASPAPSKQGSARVRHARRARCNCDGEAASRDALADQESLADRRPPALPAFGVRT